MQRDNSISLNPDPWPSRLALVAALAWTTTFVFAAADFHRRHRLGIDPFVYWGKQTRYILLPGALASAALLTIAFFLARRRRCRLPNSTDLP